MKQARRTDYNKIMMNLINFKELIETTWANCDLKDYSNLIETLRYYRQFIND